MSYIVFARKWRPQTFDEVIGQDNIISRLKNAFTQNRLAHAYLFSGPRGVGKTSTARILAKSLNCQEGPTTTACNKCISCKEISESRSMDVIEIDGASNTGVDNIRDLRENVKFSPTHGKYKIYIIDEVHMLSDAAFNALLKTLEEPPEHVKFIFATTQPHKLLPTILSRCQRFDFQHIPILKIIEQLEHILKHESIKVADEVLLAIAKSSSGSMRDAETLLDQLVSFSKGSIKLSDVTSVLGIVEQDYLFDITEAIVKKDSNGALKLLDSLISKGKDISNFTSNLIEHFRNLMIAKVTDDKSDKLFDLPPEVCEKIITQSKNFSLEEIFTVFNLLINAQDMARRLDFIRLPLEITLVKLTQKKQPVLPSDKTVTRDNKIQQVSDVGPASRNQNIAGSQKQTSSSHIQPVNQIHDIPTAGSAVQQDSQLNSGLGSSCAISEPQLELGRIKEAWADIIEKVGRVKTYIAHSLEEGIPLKIDNNSLTISFPKDSSFHKEILEKKDNRAIIERTCSEVLNSSIRINCIINKDQVAASKERKLEPFTKSALDTFRGRIID